MHDAHGNGNGHDHVDGNGHVGGNGNGHLEGNGNGLAHSTEGNDLLHALQAMRIGDFSVRLPGNQIGLAGKIADTFNEIVAANERMASQLDHVGQLVGREGKTRHRVRFGISSGAWGEMESSINTLVDDLLWPTTAVTRAIAAGGAGRPAADRRARCRRPAAAGRVPALGHDRQHHDQAAERVHLRGDARRARGRHRRQAGRPGPGARGDGGLEGT